MDISRITGTSTIWSALRALPKKTESATALSSVSGAASPTVANAIDSVKKISVPDNLLDQLKSVSSSDSGLALLKALGTNNNISSSNINSLLQNLKSSSAVDSASAVDSTSLSDKVLQGMSSGSTKENPSQGSDLLQSLMSTSNAYSTLAGLSGSGSDLLSNSGNVEKMLNSFMRIPDLSKSSPAVVNSVKRILDTLA